ncbi:MAG: response regulator, partial [Candidatus Hinthialibacter sp.]
MSREEDEKPVQTMAGERRILLVDDNPQYRSAVTRNLTLQGYAVIEAEDSVEGMDKIQRDDPQVIITDLDMRTHDEGLHFIREVKQRYPQKPVIMISAVGSFDEGALARQYGATFVLSKSRIDAEIETLYQRLERIYQILNRISELRERVEKAAAGDAASDSVRMELDSMLHDDDLDAGLKSEVYDLLDRLDRSQASSQGWMKELDEKAVLQRIESEIPGIEKLDAETRTMLAVAESMQQSGAAASLSVARNVSFSYSFAVENEVKLRIGRKINRLLTEDRI